MNERYWTWRDAPILVTGLMAISLLLNDAWIMLTPIEEPPRMTQGYPAVWAESIEWNLECLIGCSYSMGYPNKPWISGNYYSCHLVPDRYGYVTCDQR